MSYNVLVVESPAKSKTLKKYLKNFVILASYGHVRDLVPKEGAVDTENDFKMKYQLVERNVKHVDAIVAQLKNADALYLATDPDREGEAISWHLAQIVKANEGLEDKPIYRVAFHEITKSAVIDAVNNPRELSMDLINAQQARRALDYLVGFNLSPLLWKKIRRGLSAGRVQSPALRMIVEREESIEKFSPKEYWSVNMDLSFENKKFLGRLVEYNGEKLKQFSITNKEKADEVYKTINSNAEGILVVDNVSKSKRKRNPTAPFTTSTMQQESVRKLNFTAQKTMRTAQQLYEGIDVGDGAIGLITYMRTDSVSLSNEALEQIREYILHEYGKENLPNEPKVYKTKSKNAQEAHEAIRPTDVNLKPNDVKQYLSTEQFKLYSLIWKRTVASQMIHATFNQVSIDYLCGTGNKIRSNGSTLEFPGFMKLYLEGTDDSNIEDDEKLLPELHKKDVVSLDKIKPEQHFTEPPPRYSEASIVKALEEFGIGRPSTYASIISTLQQREYVVLETKRFQPTDVGRVVNKFLTKFFSQYVDYGFTAELEDNLDAVARGEKSWLPLMKDFWEPFCHLVKHIEKSVDRKDVTQEELNEKCPECGSKLALWLGKRGRFVGCTSYPDCKFTKSLNEEEGAADQEIVEGRSCPKCESDLVVKTGKYGKFIGCSSYPDCKFIESLDKPVDTNIQCPSCKKGSIMKRKSRYGTYFYACNAYPDCKYALKNPPISTECPDCKWPLITGKITKKNGPEKVCPQKGCGYSESCEEEEIPSF